MGNTGNQKLSDHTKLPLLKEKTVNMVIPIIGKKNKK